MISMSDSVKHATGAAVFACRTPNALGHFVPLGRMIGLPISLKDHGFADRVTRTGWKFFISAGLFMTDQTVNLGLITKIKRHVLKSIAGMTGGAARITAVQADAKIIDGQSSLANTFFRGGIRIQPGPVDGFVKLCSRFRMAG